MTKTLLALSSVALAAALVGCGGDPGGSTAASSTPDSQDLELKYARCMREHGIQMEDPKPGQGIRMRVNSADAAKMKAAEKACKQYAPDQLNGGTMSAQDLDRQTKLAQCLRRNGIEAEDPKPGQPFRLKMRKENEQKTQAAMKTCQKEAGMPTPGPGGGNTGAGSGKVG
jgi:hypothetical protein